MKPFCNKWAVSLASALAGMVMGGAVLAQTAAISSPTSGTTSTTSGSDPSITGTSASVPTASVTLDQFQQEHQSLVQAWSALVAQGATQDQLEAWQQQNSGAIQQFEQDGQVLGAETSAQPMAIVNQVNLPPNLPEALQNLVTNQVGLANAGAEIYNQLLQSLPSGATPQQVNALQQQAAQTFEQQYGANLQAQVQQAQALAANSASQPMPVPGPAVIPPNASSQLQAFLTERNALLTSWAQTWNQNLGADSATRQTAMQQWQQQNASNIQQMQQAAGALSNQ
jgi:hypothetical protein